MPISLKRLLDYAMPDIIQFSGWVPFIHCKIVEKIAEWVSKVHANVCHNFHSRFHMAINHCLSLYLTITEIVFNLVWTTNKGLSNNLLYDAVLQTYTGCLCDLNVTMTDGLCKESDCSAPIVWIVLSIVSMIILLLSASPAVNIVLRWGMAIFGVTLSMSTIYFMCDGIFIPMHQGEKT